MASQAKLTIRVGSTRSGSTIEFSTAGRYVSTPVNDLGEVLSSQAIQPTSSSKAFWTSVLAVVQAAVANSS